MATPVEIGARIHGESVSTPLTAVPIAGGDTALATVPFLEPAGGGTPEIAKAGAGGGMSLEPTPPVSVYTTGDAGLAIAAGATATVILETDMSAYRAISGTFKMAQNMEVRFTWQESTPFTATKQSQDDLIVTLASVPLFMDTIRYLQYLTVTVKNTSGTPSTLYGGLWGHSGPIA